MMPTSQILTQFELTTAHQTSPDLRRMDMFNRARREEIDAMLYAMNSRQQLSVKAGGSTRTSHGIANLFNGMRKSIGNMLISAGTRIQHQS